MFNYIRGTLVECGSDYVVIDNHGIGWQIFVPITVLHQLGENGDEVKLCTYLAVREDAMTLYGFIQPQDLALFKMLLSVSGVGPKAALAVLSTLSANEFFLAVMHENVKTLTRVPGVGQKSAKRLIVELKEKVTDMGKITPTLNTQAAASTEPDAYQDALAALIALGYNGTEAQMALSGISGRENMKTQELIRNALVRLGSL